MNKLNPINILLASIALFILSIVLLKQSNLELKQSNLELNKVEILSVKYSNLKFAWDNKNGVIKQVDKIISAVKIKNVLF